MPVVAVVNYGCGNINSLTRRLSQMGASTVVCHAPEDLVGVDKILLPGVGHFARAMENLLSSGLNGALMHNVVERKVPVLGICLGMQLMAKYSEEGNCSGLGWLDASVVRFQKSQVGKLKIPHMGWNRVLPVQSTAITRSILPDSEFYFVHSYHWQCRETSHVLGQTTYGNVDFTSMVMSGNIAGVQFHPEKSHESGEALLKGFLES